MECKWLMHHLTPLLPWQISRTYSTSSLLLIFLGDFHAWHHLWDSVDEDERWQVIETLMSRFHLVVLNTGDSTHVSLASDNRSCLDLTMCSPVVSAHFTWRLHDDLSGSLHFLMCLSLQSSVLHEECYPNFYVKQADWSLLSQLAKVENSFPTIDFLVDKLT
jgi:hypothetical protein